MLTLDDCMLWAGPVSSHTGYGVTHIDGTNGRSAHRVIYEAYKGEVPKGKMLDHLCRIKLCINPEHLEPVTNAENQRRGDAAKLSYDDVKEIKKLSSRKVSQYTIAEMFKVNQSTISRILNGKRWSAL